MVDTSELDLTAIREDVYPLLTEGSPALRQGAAKLVARLIMDAAAQRDKVRLGVAWTQTEAGG